jgi:hypothetical protein
MNRQSRHMPQNDAGLPIRRKAAAANKAGLAEGVTQRVIMLGYALTQPTVLFAPGYACCSFSLCTSLKFSGPKSKRIFY